VAPGLDISMTVDDFYYIKPSLAEQLFPSGEAGLLIDPSQLDTLYQSCNAFLTPVSANGDSVGIAMDIRTWFGMPFVNIMQQQAELVTNGDFEDGLTGYDSSVSNPPDTLEIEDGDLHIVNDGSAIAISGQDAASAMSVVAGQTYLVRARFQNNGTGGAVTPLLAISSSYQGAYRLTIISSGSSSTSELDWEFLFTPTVTEDVHFTITCASSVVVDFDVRELSMKLVPGNHLLQPTNANRPTYGTQLGLHWIEGNGVDQWMDSTFTIAQPWERMSSLRVLSWTSGDHVYGGVAANAGVIYQTGTTPSMLMYDGNPAPALLDELVGVDQTMWEKHDNTSSAVSVDDGSIQTGTSGTGVPGGMRLFAGYNGGVAGFWSNARLYFVAMKEGAF